MPRESRTMSRNRMAQIAHRWRVVWMAVLISFLLLDARATRAVVCAVPGDHSSITDALGDSLCTEILLGAQTYQEVVVIDRDLVLAGAGKELTTIEGRVLATGIGTEVTLEELTVDASTPFAGGCFTAAFESRDGGSVTGLNTAYRNGRGPAHGTFCLIFADGFESGSTAAWSDSHP